MRKRLALLGALMVVIGLGFLIGAGVAYSKVSAGYDSLNAFSDEQNVTLTYNEDGDLIDRGTTEGADASMSLLKDDYKYPVVDGDLDPDDPVINTASEYMYQMATIVYHTLHGEQNITLTEDDIAAAIASERLGPDGTYNGVVEAYQGQVLEPGTYTVPVAERYWTEFNRTDLLDGPAREGAWSGTAHALVAELSIGAVTANVLQMGLGFAALLGGLGLIFVALGVVVFWIDRELPKAEPAESE